MEVGYKEKENDNQDVVVDDDELQEESLEEDDTGKDKPSDDIDNAPRNLEGKRYNFVQREAMRVARNPCTYFWISFLSSLALGVIGMIAGNFDVAADNNGWNSRGTKIADRETQMHMVREFGQELYGDTTDEVWLDLINNVQDGWETDDDDERRRLMVPVNPDGMSWDNMDSWGHRLLAGMQLQPLKALDDAHHAAGYTARNLNRRRATLPVLSDHQIRLLSVLNSTEGTLLEGCDTSWYTSETLYDDTHLWPVWRTSKSTTSFFDSDLLEELCLEEQTTQSYLEQQNLCQKCQDSDRCLQPYSTVFYARLTVEVGMSMSCQELATAWTNEGQDEAHKNSLDECVADLLANYNVDRDGSTLPDSCPFGFFPTILDEFYPSTERAEYSSTIFATPEGVEEDLYDGVDNYPRGKGQISGAYDTQYEDFVNLSLDEQLLIDMSLAVGSAFVTVIAMVVHTRSPFLSVRVFRTIVVCFFSISPFLAA